MKCKDCRNYDADKPNCTAPVPYWAEEYICELDDRENASYMPPGADCECAAYECDPNG